MILLKQITQTYQAVLPELFLNLARIWGSNCPSRLVRQCYQSTCLFIEKFLKSKFGVIGKYAITSYISSMLEEKTIFKLFIENVL